LLNTQAIRMTKLLLKVQYGEDIRRLSLNERPGAADLIQLLKDLYVESLRTPFVAKYIDDEGDLISITHDKEVAEAWDFAISNDKSGKPILRLTIIPTPASDSKGKEKLDNEEQPNREVHPAICDACNQGIVGIRYKCNSCPDYDLCESCEPNCQTIHDPNHSFLKIRKSPQHHRYHYRRGHCNSATSEGTTAVPQSSVDHRNVFISGFGGRPNQFTGILPVVHPALCDSCNSRIIGIRFKCIDCPDYDLCENCMPKANTIHDSTHTFAKILFPGRRRCGGGFVRRHCNSNNQESNEAPKSFDGCP